MEQRNVDFPPVNAERIGRKLTREWREREERKRDTTDSLLLLLLLLLLLKKCFPFLLILNRWQFVHFEIKNFYYAGIPPWNVEELEFSRKKKMADCVIIVTQYYIYVWTLHL
jgi:hypothetical protein